MFLTPPIHAKWEHTDKLAYSCHIKIYVSIGPTEPDVISKHSIKYFEDPRDVHYRRVVLRFIRFELQVMFEIILDGQSEKDFEALKEVKVEHDHDHLPSKSVNKRFPP